MAYTLQINEQAPDFNLISTDGNHYSLESFNKAKGLVIFFTCNHCPYVIGSNEYTRSVTEEFSAKGISFVGINSNSSNTYIEDSFDHMIKEMDKLKFPWTYLHDKSQLSAKDYGALKTPHYFLFDESRKLIYTGRAVDYPKDTSQISHEDLKNALDEFVKGKEISQPITNPIGCNIKWEGKPKHWMPPQACDII
jgi:peroxiredoxin